MLRLLVCSAGGWCCLAVRSGRALVPFPPCRPANLTALFGLPARELCVLRVDRFFPWGSMGWGAHPRVGLCRLQRLN